MNELAKIEKKILNFWEKNKIFEKSIKQRKKGPLFSFYDGPPFATGKPHYGHILATTIKDSVLRYWTMRGYYIPRRVGWDCHGLPVENLIEKELGIRQKKEIEAMGIEKFNQHCRQAVFRTVRDFEIVLKRVGRWADYQNFYATLDNDYIESIWWVFSRLWQMKLIYQEYRVTPYCPRCETVVSNYEVSEGYKETKDNSVYLKFRSPVGFSFLVWTTTPWTLPGNMALAVNPRARYLQVRYQKELLVIAKERVSLLKGDYEIVKEIDGQKLIGIKYEPPFSYLNGNENAFKILPASFVSLEEGTGIVHTAPMYGEDDFQLAKEFKLPMTHIVDQSGNFTKEVERWSGRFVKEVEEEIIDDLTKRELLYRQEKIVHSYPFCWRCDTPLLYYALEAWYINVSKIKNNLITNNKKIRWVPSHLKEGRFGQWLENVKNWAFSRSRFWGAPIPIWRCLKCGKYKCVSKKAELPRKINDLHRPYVDKIKFNCPCGGKMERIKEVFDCWFESGAMPYGQWHYPFQNKKLVERGFPADFIAEGIDQTRGWFYTLHVLATALTLKDVGLGKTKPAFKNVIVNGFILAADGRKLSKKLKNYPETKEIFNSYGADSLRYFLLSSTAIGEDYLFSDKGVRDVWRKILLTLWNSFVFFETHRAKNFKAKKNFETNTVLDRWMISRLNSVNKEVSYWMERYELTKAVRLFEKLIDDLSNWYIRRSRKRMQREGSSQEKEVCSQTLYYLLLKTAKMMAPFTPFICEHIYRQLITYRPGKMVESVHLSNYPEAETLKIKRSLEERMNKIRMTVTMALAQRSQAGIKVRQPLSLLVIKGEGLKKNDSLLELIKEEVNVKKIKIDPKIKNELFLNLELSQELKEEGLVREVIRQVQGARKEAKLTKKDKIKIFFSGHPSLEKIILDWQEMILSETLALAFDFQKEKRLKSKEIIFEGNRAHITIGKVKG